MPNESGTVEQRLFEWAKQPGAVVTSAEWDFIADMRHARANGVGYGWMQQVIEWEWQDESPETALGPESYERELVAAQAELAEQALKEHAPQSIVDAAIDAAPKERE